MTERLVGREAEERAVSDFLDSLPRRSCALVIEGEAGIGKTAVWADAVRRADECGYRVLSCRAAAAESVLAYTVLADLLDDVDDSVWADLPAPQQQALDGALLRDLVEASEVDPRAVAAAFVAIIGRLAAVRPLVIAIDDLQWADKSSASVVAYAARRLRAGAALLCTVRTEAAAARLQLPSPDDVRRIRMQPLTVGELHQVLLMRLGQSVARPTLLRIHEVAAGNPFFALELTRELGAEGRAFEMSLPGSLNELVRARISRVGAEDVLLAIASLPNATVAMVARATNSPPDQVVQSLREAENQAVVAIDGIRLRFTHPLLAHGVYSAAAPGRRREMHRRLAELTAQPELHARHLALADTSGKPETLAALDRAAEIACGRGAPAAAAELVELAVGLAGDNDLRRKIRCATYHFVAGDPARARRILDAVIAALPPCPTRAEALHQLGLIVLSDDSFLEAAGVLEQAVDESGTDAALRVRILISLAFALLNAGRHEQAYARVEQAVTDAERLGAGALLGPALGMRVMIDFMGGKGFDELAMQRAVGMEGPGSPVPLALRPRAQMSLLRAWTGELGRAREELAEIERQCLALGEEAELIFIGFHLTLIDIWLGNFASAAVIADATMERATQLGGDFPMFIGLTLRAAVAAHVGRLDDARSDLTQAIAAAQRCGSRRLAEWPATIAGFVEVSSGDYQAAMSELEPLLPMVALFPEASEIISSSFVPEAVEAMVGLGRLDDAEPLVEALERNGRRLDRAWTIAVGMRCRAMLQAARGDVAGAMTSVELALAEHERLAMPFERARTQLLCGQLQRRQRRRDTASAALREARDTFEQLGTTVWAERAETELARGLSIRGRDPGLTATEERVADLAVSGLTNRDIAAAIFVSPKTVEVNLSRVYRKLSIRSRAELYRALQTWKEKS
ncbi:MAG TPA: LuxR family transcriptional regulator [Mycobacterium sp.]|nr:LuxR family transcriptional regulator [Mycobacterium sp.]